MPTHCPRYQASNGQDKIFLQRPARVQQQQQQCDVGMLWFHGAKRSPTSFSQNFHSFLKQMSLWTSLNYDGVESKTPICLTVSCPVSTVFGSRSSFSFSTTMPCHVGNRYIFLCAIEASGSLPCVLSMRSVSRCYFIPSEAKTKKKSMLLHDACETFIIKAVAHMPAAVSLTNNIRFPISGCHLTRTRFLKWLYHGINYPV